MANQQCLDTSVILLLASTFVAFTIVLLLIHVDTGIYDFDTICDRMCYDADTGNVKNFALIDKLHFACAPCPILLFYRPDERQLPEKWVRIKSWHNKTTVIFNNYGIEEFQHSFQIRTKYSITTLKGSKFHTQYGRGDV